MTGARYSIVNKTTREVGEIFAREQGAFIEWQCPRCSWYRVRTNKEWWEKLVIQHPNYGNVTNFAAFQKDINSHDCEQVRLARLRYGYPLGPRQVPYTHREEK